MHSQAKFFQAALFVLLLNLVNTARADESKTIQEAVALAKTYVDFALPIFSESSIVREAFSGPLFREPHTDYNYKLEVLRKMQKKLTAGVRIEVKPKELRCRQRPIVAYTLPGKDRIFLCPRYLNIGPQNQAEVLIHEVIHLVEGDTYPTDFEFQTTVLEDTIIVLNGKKPLINDFWATKKLSMKDGVMVQDDDAIDRLISSMYSTHNPSVVYAKDTLNQMSLALSPELRSHATPGARVLFYLGQRAEEKDVIGVEPNCYFAAGSALPEGRLTLTSAAEKEVPLEGGTSRIIRVVTQLKFGDQATIVCVSGSSIPLTLQELKDVFGSSAQFEL